MTPNLYKTAGKLVMVQEIQHPTGDGVFVTTVLVIVAS